MGDLEEGVAALREEFLDKFREVSVDARAFHKRVKDVPFLDNPPRVHDPSGHPEWYFVGVEPPEYYKHHNKWFRASTRLIKGFVDGLYGMRHNAAWVQSEAEKIWPLFDKECHEWIAIACELEPRADNPCDAEGTATRARNEGTATTVEAEKICARLEAGLAKAQRSVLNRVRIQVAQEKELATHDALAAQSKNAKLKATDNFRKSCTICRNFLIRRSSRKSSARSPLFAGNTTCQ